MRNFYTVASLAERWECGPRPILSLIKAGILPAVSIGNALRIKAEDVESYEASGGNHLAKEENDVYVIRCENYIKIGKAADTGRRIATLQMANPFSVEVIAILTEGDGHKLERELHARFSEYRHRGEWFRCEGALDAWVSGGCVNK